MKSKAKTVGEYLAALPEDRRATINAVRETILASLPKGYEECMSYGMIGYVVPHGIYPAGYHCDPKLPLPYANLGAQKNHVSLHLMGLYGDKAAEEWFRKTWTDTGKKLDMGTCCVRFKKLEDVPLKVIGQMIARFPVKVYTARMQELSSKRKPAARKSASRKTK